MTEEMRVKGTYHLFSRRESIRNKVSWRGNELTVKKAWAVSGAHRLLKSHYMWAVWSELSFEVVFTISFFSSLSK